MTTHCVPRLAVLDHFWADQCGAGRAAVAWAVTSTGRAR